MLRNVGGFGFQLIRILERVCPSQLVLQHLL